VISRVDSGHPPETPVGPGTGLRNGPRVVRFLTHPVGVRISRADSGQTTHGPSWGYLKVNFQETLSIFGDKCPQNCSQNDRTTLQSPRRASRGTTRRETRRVLHPGVRFRSHTTQGSSWGYLKVNYSETLSVFGDKCPKNGSKNDPMAQRTTLESPHEGPSVVAHVKQPTPDFDFDFQVQVLRQPFESLPLRLETALEPRTSPPKTSPNSAHVRQSTPDSGLCFQVKPFKLFYLCSESGVLTDVLTCHLLTTHLPHSLDPRPYKR
jgi:hypothetical protein